MRRRTCTSCSPSTGFLSCNVLQLVPSAGADLAARDDRRLCASTTDGRQGLFDDDLWEIVIIVGHHHIAELLGRCGHVGNGNRIVELLHHRELVNGVEGLQALSHHEAILRLVEDSVEVILLQREGARVHRIQNGLHLLFARRARGFLDLVEGVVTAGEGTRLRERTPSASARVVLHMEVRPLSTTA